MKMNSEIRRSWVEALRSGKYNQGTGMLTRIKQNSKNSDVTYEHCCLGVLCELALEAGVELEVAIQEPEFYPDGSMLYGGFKKYGDATAWLPDEVTKWAGIEDCDPEVYTQDGTTTLSAENDEGKTFDEIAGLIEEDSK